MVVFVKVRSPSAVLVRIAIVNVNGSFLSVAQYMLWSVGQYDNFSKVSYAPCWYDDLACPDGISSVPALVDLHRKLMQILHRKEIHLESQNMAHLVLGFLVLFAFGFFVELCLKR